MRITVILAKNKSIKLINYAFYHEFFIEMVTYPEMCFHIFVSERVSAFSKSRTCFRPRKKVLQHSL